VAFVTGAGSGVGRAGAQRFAAEGARVAVAEIDGQRGRRIAGGIVEAGGDAAWIAVDVRDSASVRAAVDETIARFGGLDVVFHNAMNVPLVNDHDRMAVDLPEETWDEIVRVVLYGTFHVVKHAGAALRAAGRGGSIVLTSTVDALVAQPGFDGYTAAKGGVNALTRSLAAGLAPHRIRVNALAPSFVSSESQMGWLADPAAARVIGSMHLLGIPTPEDVAAAALYLASDEAAMVTGIILPVDSGYLAVKGSPDVTAAIQGHPAPGPDDDVRPGSEASAGRPAG
jgi:NAD(P)-dependent dehydrogenase (short-subunit alcohol dehydrogenase family)